MGGETNTEKKLPQKFIKKPVNPEVLPRIHDDFPESDIEIVDDE